MLEAALQERVINKIQETYLDDVWVFKTHDQCRVGVPDLLICFFGHFVAIELKRPRIGEKFPGGRDPYIRPTRMQEYNIRKINRAGGSAFAERDLCDIMIKLDKIYKSLHLFGEAHR
jgi:hypothetical protein